MVYVSELSSSSLIRNSFLFMVLLTVSPLTVNGFNARVKYPSNLTSSAETTRYVTDWFFFVNSMALFFKNRSTSGFFGQKFGQKKPESNSAEGRIGWEKILHFSGNIPHRQCCSKKI